MRAPRPFLTFTLATLAFAPALFPAEPSRATQEAISIVRQLNEVFVDVSERAAASVVVIQVAQKIDLKTGDGGHPLLESMPEELRRRFENYLERERRDRERFGPRFNGEGSGIIYRDDGHILTNAHVVEDAERIRVRLRDGREFDAEVQGTDSDSDIAILRLKEPVEGLVPARFANSDAVRVGEFAIAIGAPYELEFSVTFGHISAKGRAGLTGGMMDEDFLQTDANINPGNSGGPLLNLDGEVVGVNSMIRGVGTGICFAIPSNLAREVAEQLIDTGRFQRSWLGVSIDGLRANEKLRKRFAPLQDGVVILDLVQDGPAAKAALRLMDVITAVDGRPVASVPQLRREITRKRPGSDVRLAIHRDGQPLEITVQPEPMPDPIQRLASSRGRSPVVGPDEESDDESAGKTGPESNPAPAPVTPPAVPVVSRLGLTVQPPDPELAARHRFGRTQGVVVTAIEADSPLADYAFQPGDLIYEIDRRATRNTADFSEALESARTKKRFQIRYQRAGRKLSAMILNEAGESDPASDKNP